MKCLVPVRSVQNVDDSNNLGTTRASSAMSSGAQPAILYIQDGAYEQFIKEISELVCS